MRLDTFLAAMRAMPLASPEVVTGGEPFVVLSPHPDDESLGMGGLIAAACAAGQPVEVITVTDGAGSHPRSKLYPRDRLVALRKQESEQAAAALGLPRTRLTHLDLPDTQAPSDGPAFDQAVERILAVLDDAGARTLFVSWGRDPHCDHEAADRMARAARRRNPGLRLWSYPIWGLHLDPGTELAEPAPTGYRVDITPWLARKHAAIAAHASQMTDLIADDPDGFRFDPPRLAPFLGPTEYYFEVPA